MSKLRRNSIPSSSDPGPLIAGVSQALPLHVTHRFRSGAVSLIKNFRLPSIVSNGAGVLSISAARFPSFRVNEQLAPSSGT